jgi:hypothetical protein
MVFLLLGLVWLEVSGTKIALKFALCEAVGFQIGAEGHAAWIENLCTIESYGSGQTDRDLFDIIAAVGTVVSAAGVLFGAYWTVRAQRLGAREAALREREMELRIRQLEKQLKGGSTR